MLKKNAVLKKGIVLLIIIVFLNSFSIFSTLLNSESTSVSILLEIGNPVMKVNNATSNIDPISTDTVPVIIQSRTLLPIRAIIEAIGGQISWNAESRLVTIDVNGQNIKLSMLNPLYVEHLVYSGESGGMVSLGLYEGSKTIMVNGKPDKNDVPAMIINDRTFMPLRFIAENAGCKVDWYDEKKEVFITYPDPSAIAVTTDTPTPLPTTVLPTINPTTVPTTAPTTAPTSVPTPMPTDTVMPTPNNNQPPEVYAGEDKNLTVSEGTTSINETIALDSATATDDGNPNPTLEITWSLVSGSGSAVFNPSNTTLNPTVTLTGEPGEYVLRLTADDGEKSASDDIIVSVNEQDPYVTHIGSSNGAGTLYIVGGGASEENMIRFMELIGGMSSHFIHIPTAGVEKGESFPSNYTSGTFSDIGVENDQYTVIHTWDKSEANSDAFVEPIKNADAVWILGGMQGRLAEAYRGTKVQEELIKLLERGGIIGGSSAGASIQSDIMIGGGSEDYGLGFLLNSVIDQHLNSRDREHRLADPSRNCLSDMNYLLGIGISEATAVLLSGSEFTVEGSDYVYVWDYKDGNNQVYVLTEGATFDHESRTLKMSGEPFLTYENADFVNYEDGQSTVGEFNAYIEEGDQCLQIDGNQWIAVPYDYNVTDKTIIEFDFYSSVQGEIHGIGLDDDLVSSTERRFRLYGTDSSNSDIDDYQDYFDGNSALECSWTHYRIPLGKHYTQSDLTGAANYLFFVNADAGESAQSIYKNVYIYEDGSQP